VTIASTFRRRSSRALHGGRGERPVGRDARVVDEQFDVERCRSCEQRLGAGSGREVSGQRLETAATRVDLIGQGLQALAATRHREDGVPALAERERELAAETRRGACDDRPARGRRVGRGSLHGSSFMEVTE
jgi:hypothetical protein